MQNLIFVLGSTRRTGPRTQTLRIIRQLKSNTDYKIKLVVVSKLGILRSIIYLLKNNAFALISTGLIPDMLSAFIKLVINRPKFFTYVRCDFSVDYNSKFGKLFGNFFYKLHRLFLNQSDAIMCVSEEIFDNMTSYFGNKANFIPNPLENGNGRVEFKNLSGLDRKLILGYVGSNLPRKRVSEVVSFSDKYSYELQFQLDIYGFESSTGSFSPNIKFHGYEKKSVIFSNIDMLILLSTSEGTPNVVLEALAHGMPVVLSDIRSHRDLKNHFENWPIFLCNVHEPETIMRAYQNAVSFKSPEQLVVPEIYSQKYRTDKIHHLLFRYYL